MANSKYASTRETTNFARVARIILGPCTGVLCALLTKEIPPPTLSQKVKTYLANLPKRIKPPITKEQERVIHIGTYSDFDVTLLYVLLRNISNIPPHAKQWGNKPIPSDRSVSANIERIRLIRNQYGHCPDISICDSDFNKKILEISSIIQDLEKYLGTSTLYQDAVVEIKKCCMDPEQKSRYIKEYLGVYKKNQNISDLIERDRLEWEEDDRVFLETHNFPVMLEQVRTQPYVTFVGGPGSGKTATVRHIALILQKEGYELFPIKEINKVEDYCHKTIPQVFVIDDVLGVFRLNELELHNIRKYKERLKNPINQQTKTLLTCREAVFRNELMSDSILAKTENAVFLQSKENTLNEDDKKNLLEKYFLDRDVLTSDNLASSSSMFPLLCKLFSSEPKYKVYGTTFFISPFDCILKELGSLKIHNKLQYVSLVLLMANENKLSERILNNENSGTKEKSKSENMFAEMKCSILRKCKVPSTTENFKLIDALLEMEETYTKKSDGEFTFIHDSMFEIIAYHFGRLFPELILQYPSSNYIASHIKVDKDNSQRKRKIDCEEDEAFENNKVIEKDNESETITDLYIHLHEAQYPKLADRLFRDLQNEEFYDVFGNEALKSPSILQYFIAIMEKTSYDNLYDLLLTEIKNFSKICKWENEQGKNKRNNNMKTRAHKCLINEILIDGQLTSKVRGISWVIFFGHHQILHNVLNQMIVKKENVDDLFRYSFNQGPRPNPNTDQDVTEENDWLNHEMMSESWKKKDHVEKDRKSDIDTDCDSEYYSNSDTYSDSGTDSDTYSVSSVDICNDPVIIEQCRLLCLGCYSGDLNTVQILLKHVNTDAALNIKKWPKTFFNLEENALCIACHYGYEDIVMKLLEAGADVNIYLYLETPLTNACINGNIDIVRALLRFRADVNKTNEIYTPLQYACQYGHTLIVEQLIKAGADVNLNVPLKIACLAGHLSTVRQLIKLKANVNLSHRGITPLLYACTNGKFDIVNELIAAGADVNQTSNYEACFEHITCAKKSPVTTACDGGYFNVLKLLLKSGAKIDPKDKVTLNFPCYWDYLITLKRLIEMESSFDLNDTNETSFIAECYRGHLGKVKDMVKCRVDVNMKDGDKTPLIVACYKNHLHVVKALIEAGADVNLRNDFFSPLQVACYDGHLSIVKELTKTEFTDHEISSVGKALMGACFFGHSKVVKELITCHAGVILKHGKDTLLKTACYMGHLDIVKDLIEAGADVNQSDGNSTLLTVAYEEERYNVFSELIRARANVNQSNGHNSLLLAECEKGRWRVGHELINAGADVNQSDGNKTPLTTACENGCVKIVKALIKARADVNQSDGNKTPLTTACENGLVKIVKALIKAGADVNQSDGNKTPITAAADNLHWIVYHVLIKAGAVDNQSY